MAFSRCAPLRLSSAFELALSDKEFTALSVPCPSVCHAISSPLKIHALAAVYWKGEGTSASHLREAKSLLSVTARSEYKSRVINAININESSQSWAKVTSSGNGLPGLSPDHPDAAGLFNKSRGQRRPEGIEPGAQHLQISRTPNGVDGAVQFRQTHFIDHVAIEARIFFRIDHA